MARRGDAPLIKHLATTWGLLTAQAWQQLSYLLPGDDFDERLHEHTHTLAAATTAIRLLFPTKPSLTCGTAPISSARQS